MRLSELEENCAAYIDFVGGDSGIRRRLTELGFIKGRRIVCKNVSPAGSPTAYLICGTKLALRKSDCERIWVTV